MPIEIDPICGYCYGPMQMVEVHHKHRPTTRWPLCPACLTTHHLDLADQPTAVELDEPAPRRHLRAVP